MNAASCDVAVTSPLPAGGQQVALRLKLAHAGNLGPVLAPAGKSTSHLRHSGSSSPLPVHLQMPESEMSGRNAVEKRHLKRYHLMTWGLCC